MTDENVRVVVSGSSWMGSGLGSIESALYRLFTQADDEVTIVAYAIGSTHTTFFQQLVPLLQRGVRVRLLINRFPLQLIQVQQHLLTLQQSFVHLFQIATFTPQSDEADLHAKIVIVDRTTALVGSANLSFRGLIDNHELGVIVTGTAAVEIAKAVDLLFASPRTSFIHS